MRIAHLDSMEMTRAQRNVMRMLGRRSRMKMSPEQRSEAARGAAQARWLRVPVGDRSAIMRAVRTGSTVQKLETVSRNEQTVGT